MAGMSEREARAFLWREIKRNDALRFYWESEEVEEAVEILVSAIAKLIEANNEKQERDVANALRFRT
jgi:hypothetical protein